MLCLWFKRCIIFEVYWGKGYLSSGGQNACTNRQWQTDPIVKDLHLCSMIISGETLCRRSSFSMPYMICHLVLMDKTTLVYDLEIAVCILKVCYFRCRWHTKHLQNLSSLYRVIIRFGSKFMNGRCLDNLEFYNIQCTS